VRLLYRAVTAFVLSAIVSGCAPHVLYALSNADKARFEDRVLRVR
jgi:hypothetical protein